MASLNKVTLIGNLGRDPETRTFPSGDQVCNFSVATTDKWKDKQSGEMREATEWHRVECFGRLAEIASQYLRKGSQVYIEGSIRTRKYQDKDGAEKTAVDIRCSEMKMLGSRQGMGGPSGDDEGGGGGGYSQRAPAPASRPAASAPRQAPAKSSSGFDDMDDDIPF